MHDDKGSRKQEERDGVTHHKDLVEGDDVVVVEALHDADLRVQVPLELLVGSREPLHVHDLDRHGLLQPSTVRSKITPNSGPWVSIFN
jgi:hypothetical protein